MRESSSEKHGKRKGNWVFKRVDKSCQMNVGHAPLLVFNVSPQYVN